MALGLVHAQQEQHAQPILANKVLGHPAKAFASENVDEPLRAHDARQRIALGLGQNHRQAHGGSPDGSGTTLGRIGYGYVYPDFRTRFTYKTPNINGFDLEVGIFDPQEPASTVFSETDSPQFQAEANYKTDFEGGNAHFWASFLWQEQSIALSGGGSDDAESFGWNIGIDLNMGGFNVMGSYYDGEALGTHLFNLGGAGDSGCTATACAESDNDGFIVQGAYTFNGTTKVGVSFGQSTEKPAGGSRYTNDLWTVGVYHDVNSWLKVIAEYGQADASGGIQAPGEHDVFSIGGFLLW